MKRALAMGCMLGSLALAATAKAETVFVTYTGTVTSVTGATGEPESGDPSGIFGGGDLIGQKYTAVYKVTNVSGLKTYSADLNTSEIYGGTSAGAPSPVSETITIGTHTFHIAGAFDGEETLSLDSDSFIHDLAEDKGANFEYLGDDTMTNYSGNLPPSLNFFQTFQATASKSILGNGVASFEQLNGYSESILSTDTSVVVSASIPEPASWALMLAGLGLTGAGLRLRSRTVAANAY